MSGRPMDLERFAALLDAYGGDYRRWPDAERDAALAFLRKSAEAQTLHAGARAFDRLLDRLPQPAMRPDLVERVLDAFPAGRAASGWRALMSDLWPVAGRSAWRPAAAFACAALVGLGTGIVAPLALPFAPPPDGVVAAEDALFGGGLLDADEFEFEENAS